jgi:hypothetical protein
MREGSPAGPEPAGATSTSRGLQGFRPASQLLEEEIRDVVDPLRLLGRIHRLEQDLGEVRGQLSGLQRVVTSLIGQAPGSTEGG